MADSARLARTRLAGRILLALIAAAMAAVLFLSERPVGLTDMVRIEELAVLLERPQLEPVRRYTEIGSGLIPYFPGEIAPAHMGPPPVKLGWAYREISALRMPFFARSEFGPATYIELPHGRQFALLDPDQIRMIDEMAGGRAAQDARFAWWNHLWGWLIVLALVGWTLLRRREARIRDDEHWAA